ncbi:hypothetical protein T484DRAFT_1852472 [Baffinella frigidus]|nr:hypothetical protein T484DRAFT_1852472 [Cryptophyta sp. CCMP2293]
MTGQAGAKTGRPLLYKEGKPEPKKGDRYFTRKYRSPLVFDLMDTALGLLPSKENIALGKPVHASSFQLQGLLPSKENIAHGNPVHASSFQVRESKDDKLLPASVVDGSLSTRWGADLNGTKLQNLAIHLMEAASTDTCDVYEVRLHWEVANARAYFIDVSRDLREWLPAFEETRAKRAEPKAARELQRVCVS